MWNVQVKIIGSLGAIPKQFGNRLKQSGITAGTAQVQKTVLLGMARILRKVLEVLWLDFNSIFQYIFTVCQLNNNDNNNKNRRYVEKDCHLTQSPIQNKCIYKCGKFFLNLANNDFPRITQDVQQKLIRAVR